MPRPYFVLNGVEGLSCSPEYGSPSGHGNIFLIFSYFNFFLFYCYLQLVMYS